MASAAITVAVNDTAVKAKLERLVTQGKNLRVVMGDIGFFLEESTRHRFSTGLDPDGNAWAPVSPEYALRKATGQIKIAGGSVAARSATDLLRLTGQMESQITHQADDRSVTIGSPELYAATHQFGRDNIPARPFLGVSETDLQEVLALLEDHLTA